MTEAQRKKRADDLARRIVEAGPLTDLRKNQLRSEMARRSIGLRWERGHSGRLYCILKGPGGTPTCKIALTLLDPFLPLLMIHKGPVVLPDQRWEIALWVDPPVAEYMRRWELGTTMHGLPE